jgi:hypothetical protein
MLLEHPKSISYLISESALYLLIFCTLTKLVSALNCSYVLRFGSSAADFSTATSAAVFLPLGLISRLNYKTNNNKRNHKIISNPFSTRPATSSHTLRLMNGGERGRGLGYFALCHFIVAMVETFKFYVSSCC